MKILHVIPSLSSGGAPRGLLEIAEYQLAHGHDVQILQFSDSGSVAQLPCCKHTLNLKWRFSSPLSRLRLIRKATDAISTIRPEIVHSHLFPADYVAAYASRRVAPHVAHIRDTQPWLATSDLSSRIKKWMFRRAFLRSESRFAAVSAAAADYTILNLGLPRDRVRVVLNGIRFDRFSVNAHDSRDADRFVIGCAGRLSPEKGQPLLLHAFSKMHLEMPNCMLRFCGIGSQQTLLERMSDTMGIAHAVYFDGQVSDINHWYHSLDALVVPSLAGEGLPRVIMEAMYCGIPVVASDTAGSRESVIDGVTGFVIPSGNSEEIYRRLNKLGRDHKLRLRMGTESRRVATERFSVERVGSEILSLYESLLSNRPECGNDHGWKS